VRGTVVLIGYLRVAPGDSDDAAAQRRALAEAGCEQVVEERPGPEDSGERPALRSLLARIHPGDIVVVPQLDSLGGSLPEVVKQVQQLTAAGAGLRSLDEALDAPAPRHPADTAALEGQGGSRGTGVVRHGAGGRPPKLSPDQQAEVIEEVLSGRSKAAAMAKKHKVNPATISRLLAARRATAAAPASGGPIGKDGAAADRILGVLPPSALDERLAIGSVKNLGQRACLS
jgi:transposase-like protein